MAKPSRINLRILHGIGKRVGKDHEALSEIATTMFDVGSMSQLSAGQMEDIASVIDPNFHWFEASGHSAKPSQAQLDLMQQLWVENSINKTKESFQNWLGKAFGIDHPVWIQRHRAGHVIKIMMNKRWRSE